MTNTNRAKDRMVPCILKNLDRLRYTRIPMRSLMILFLLASSSAQTAADIERHVRAQIGFLASDALQGRGSATPNEEIAAAYLASEMQVIGLQPAGDGSGATRSFIQNVPFAESHVVGAMALKAGDHTWYHGKDIAVTAISSAHFGGPLLKLMPGAQVRRGAIILLPIEESGNRSKIRQLLRQGAAAVLLSYGSETRERFEAARNAPVDLHNSDEARNVVMLGPQATQLAQLLPEGSTVRFNTDAKIEHRMTRNVIGFLRGRTDDAITISAHFDHLGVKGAAGDTIYNGADDDASGTVAVLELARVLAQDEKPLRNVYFILFGSEEIGGIGSNYFEQHPPLPLTQIVADIQFEMLGRPDPKVAPALLWMTGFDRSNLGEILKAHGASLAADPYPEQNFFERSDNYSLAKKGIVAHTIGSFALHAQYHQPDDDIAHLDFGHLSRSIRSLIAPVRWLANADFRPAWSSGKKP